jgi:class 3 adenylate cyclase
MPSELSGSWTHFLDYAAPLVWPILSDTVRFNEMSGLPRYALSESTQPDGSVRRVAQARVAHFDIQWEELPVEWVAGQSFFQRRLFLNGPLIHMDASMSLEPAGEGALATYHIAIKPRHPVIGPYVAGRLIRGAERTFTKCVQGADEFLCGARTEPFDLGAPVLHPGGEARIRDIITYLQTGPYDHGLSARLGDLILRQPDADACRIRPKLLARKWAVDQRHAVEICLAAVRSGLLRLTWDLLCPRCRGAKFSAASLGSLQQAAHCPSCNITYQADFNRNVELVFHPSAALRDCPTCEYCLSGPQTTPHVLIQQRVEAGESKLVRANLAPGDYRARSFSGGMELDFSLEDNSCPSVILTQDGISLRTGGTPGEFRFVNETTQPQYLVIESRLWMQDALTAHQVTTLHTFRHLFPDEVLSFGEELSIDSVTVLFTDLQGSTALYREIGDGPAYQLVREHFRFLIDIVRAHDGALVKTIGDAVMAAFISPQQAVLAALAMQEKIGGLNRQSENVTVNIKIGLHYGRCILVNLNDRLDYFGTTVNLASRLQSESRGGDIVISEALAGDPLVAPIIERYPLTRETMILKGFEQPIALRRILGAA